MISIRPHHRKLRRRIDCRARMLIFEPFSMTSDREKRLVERFLAGPWASRPFRKDTAA